MKAKCKPIGVFDSGVGGISVLKEAIKLLPYENFIYYGDSKNAPYGVKKVDEVRMLSLGAVDFLLCKGAKAIVVACNTATSAAVEEIRKMHDDLPVIGIEPALKPAVELETTGDIVIMATPMTLAESKFRNLMDNYQDRANIKPLPCAGLAEMIENGIFSGPLMNEYLRERIASANSESIGAIVLGCTHYPFMINELRKVVGEHMPIIDGSEGTSKQLRRQLEKQNLLNDSSEYGSVSIYNSLNEDLVKLSYELLNA